MGLLWSRFKPKPTIKETLDDIDQRIKQIHTYKLSTERRQKRLVGALVFYSSLLYAFALLITYIWYFPRSYEGQALMVVLVLLFPCLILLAKRLIQWLFKQRITRKDEELKELIGEKREVLDKVMETETYKVAMEILEKYDPETLRKHKGEEKMSPLKPLALPDTSTLRQRSTSSTGGKIVGISSPQQRTPVSSPATRALSTPGFSSVDRRVMPFAVSTSSMMTPVGPRSFAATTPDLTMMARPVLPRERSAFDRVIDFLVGDGPGNRYALICRKCSSHNGMALKEEYEYLAFRCCYCFHWNQPRKQRPQPPRFSEFTFPPGETGDRSRSSLTNASAGLKLSDSESSGGSCTPLALPPAEHSQTEGTSLKAMECSTCDDINLESEQGLGGDGGFLNDTDSLIMEEGIDEVDVTAKEKELGVTPLVPSLPIAPVTPTQRSPPKIN